MTHGITATQACTEDGTALGTDITRITAAGTEDGTHTMTTTITIIITTIT